MANAVIVLPNRKRVTLGQYATAWRVLLAADPTDEFRGFEWYPVPARDLLRDFRRGLDDRINRHDRARWSLLHGNPNRADRLFKRLDAAVKRGAIRFECRWCGFPIECTTYLQPHRRFCSAGCDEAYSC